MAERLQKILAARGVGPRRGCEQLIRDGRVTVNGHRVRTLPVLIDPEVDEIRVDGRPVVAERLVYYLLNKPRGIVCTASDPAGRTRAVDLLDRVRERVYPVGRLDADSDGLLILTNDGELTNRLTHPRYGTPKTYRVEISGRIEPDGIDRLRRGIWLSEGKTRSAVVKVVHRGRQTSVVDITLREGRNRQVRRMLARLGHKVKRLTRVRIGRLTARGLGVGRYRRLTPDEVRYLKRAARRRAEASSTPPSSARPVARTKGRRRS